MRPPHDRPSFLATRGPGAPGKPLAFSGIEIKRLYERIRNTREGAASALGALVQLEGGHQGRRSVRVAVLALEIGHRLGLPARAIRDLEISALLHDIGFLCLPGALRSRRGRLSAEERQLIHRHPELGRAILSRIPGFESAANIVANHHERPDGRGYPAAVRGDAIPRPARVLAVAEALHAMLTGRSYRARLPLGEALDRLRRGAGWRFDGQVVEQAGRLAASFERLLTGPWLGDGLVPLPSAALRRYDSAPPPTITGRASAG